MKLNQIEKNKIVKIIHENKKFITQYRMRDIKNKEKRSLLNLKEFFNISLPEHIDGITALLHYIDPNDGICERSGCDNLKSRDSGRWILRPFCSRKCADLDFGEKQKGRNNSFHNISDTSRKSMGEKISNKIKKRILDGSFTPNITNSWANSKIKVKVDGDLKFVRSSWEAYFWIMNPHLHYETVRIPYFDSRRGTHRTYITDFCDSDNKIIYEIKPESRIETNDEKITQAKKWCLDNSYSYKIITQEWISKNYDRNLLIGQPNEERISYLIEKMIKYENKIDRKN